MKTPGEKTRLHRQQSMVTLNDLKVGVVWVENFDDVANFPTEALLVNVSAEQSPNFSLRDVVLVFVHVMSNELLKVKLVGHQGIDKYFPFFSDFDNEMPFDSHNY